MAPCCSVPISFLPVSMHARRGSRRCEPHRFFKHLTCSFSSPDVLTYSNSCPIASTCAVFTAVQQYLRDSVVFAQAGWLLSARFFSTKNRKVKVAHTEQKDQLQGAFWSRERASRKYNVLGTTVVSSTLALAVLSSKRESA